jgi:predicted protein tyrosine phosphatase
MFKEKSRDPHPLSEVKPKAEATVFFRSDDNRVLLSNVQLALSRKKLAKLGVGAVLTLMSPDHELLADIFTDQSVRDVVYRDVTFHLVDIMDVADPSVLDDPLAVLCESFAFIEEALSRGLTILVHCELGQRRSPTCLIAWLAAKHGLSVDAAIDKIGAQYSGWKEKYLKSRADWIAVIKQFAARRDPLVRKWRADNAASVARWFPKPPADDVPRQDDKRRKKTTTTDDGDDD